MICFRLDDSTLMTESKDELKSLLMRVKEDSESACLKLNSKKKKKKKPLKSWYPAPLLHDKKRGKRWKE